MNTPPDKLHDEYIQYLKSCVTKYMSILEDILGPRDPRFVFGTVKKSDRNPHTHFPNDHHFCLRYPNFRHQGRHVGTIASAKHGKTDCGTSLLSIC